MLPAFHLRMVDFLLPVRLDFMLQGDLDCVPIEVKGCSFRVNRGRQESRKYAIIYRSLIFQGSFYILTQNKSEAYFLKEIKEMKDIKEIKDMAEQDSGTLITSRFRLITMQEIFLETDKKIIQCIKKYWIADNKMKTWKKEIKCRFFSKLSTGVRCTIGR